MVNLMCSRQLQINGNQVLVRETSNTGTVTEIFMKFKIKKSKPQNTLNRQLQFATLKSIKWSLSPLCLNHSCFIYKQLKSRELQ